MTATASESQTQGTQGGGRGRGRRRWVPWVAALFALAVVAVLLGAPRSSDSNDLDPASTSSSGTKALVMLLDQSGARVDVTKRSPGADTDVAVLLVDTTDVQMTDDLTRWVRAGGVLVVADPASSFAPNVSSSAQPFALGPASIRPGECTIAALSAVGSVWPPNGGEFFSVPSGAGRCFTEDRSAFVVDQPTGQGHIVSVGSADVFTNGALDQYDNSVLAVALMAPRTGTRVSMLWGMDGAGGAKAGPSLGSLISIGFKLAVVELLIAFVIYAWWRARRLGQPVLESQPVQIGGSELVSAHGNLLQQSHDPDRAARLLRSELRRSLAERLGLPRNAAAEVVAEVTAARTGADRARVLRAVADTPIRSEDELLDLARDIDTIRTEVLHGTAP